MGAAVVLYDFAGNELALSTDVNGQVSVPVNLPGVISVGNSTQENLLADEVFTGEWEEIKDYGIIKVSIFSDKGSVLSGLDFQQSPDQSIIFDEPYSYMAGSHKLYTPNPVSRYFRVVYTNTDADQTAFSIQTIYNYVYAKPTSHRLGDTVTGEDDSELVTAALKVRTNDDSTYANIDVQNPLPTDGDATYAKDLLLLGSDIGSFTGGTVSDLLGANDFITTLTATGATNPKYIEIRFKRPVLTSLMGFATAVGDFSNTKVIATNFAGTEFTLLDESGDSTKKTQVDLRIGPVVVMVLRLEFHTADTCSLNGFLAAKDQNVVSRLQGVSELTGIVEDVSSFRGSLNVNTALVHKVGVNLFFFRETGVGSTLAVAASKGDVEVTVVDATGFVVGNKLRLTSTLVQGQPFLKITNIATNVITLDRPLIVDLEIGDDADIVTTDLNVAGSLVSPVVFRIQPPNGGLDIVWQLTRLMISMTDATSMDDGKFGGIDPLVNGVVLRVVKGDGTTQELTNWKTNGDMALDMYDTTYTDKAPSGENGLRGRWTFTKAEFIVELDGAAGDKFELLVQDDLTDLTSYGIKSQGRLFGG